MDEESMLRYKIEELQLELDLNIEEDLTKMAVATKLYQKFGEHFFDSEEAVYFLDCLAYLSGCEPYKEKAIMHVGEYFISECLSDI